MIRLGLCFATVSLMLAGIASAETISLTRVENSHYDDDQGAIVVELEQVAHSEGSAYATGEASPYYDSSTPPFQNDFSNYSSSTSVGAMAVVGFNIAEATDYTDAVCNTAPTVSNFTPSVNVVTGGPMIVTGAPETAGAGCYGFGVSKADFTVGTPTDPNATLVLTGTITMSASPGGGTNGGKMRAEVGGSWIEYTQDGGCYGVIKDLSVPGGQYSVYSPSAAGGTWNFSQVVAKGSNVRMYNLATYSQSSEELCSEYPDFNVAAFMSVNAP